MSDFLLAVMCMIVVGIERVPAIMPATREPNWPFGLSSTATSRRSSFGTKPLASISSRSSRSFSSLRIGSRDSAQRKVGGMASVVSTAIATIIVNRFWLSAPIDRPTVATITSVEPRAFMPVASASASRRLQAAELAAEEGAAELAERGDGDQPQASGTAGEGPSAR